MNDNLHNGMSEHDQPPIPLHGLTLRIETSASFAFDDALLERVKDAIWQVLSQAEDGDVLTVSLPKAEEAGRVEALAYERAYFERGFIAAAAWSMTKRDDAKLSDAVIDHAWAHRDEGVDEGDILPIATPPQAGEGVAIPAGFRLVESRADDHCGCPEEEWDTPFGYLSAHLNAGSPSNACLDNGDEGEREVTLTADTVDAARSAIFAWAGIAAMMPRPTHIADTAGVQS